MRRQMVRRRNQPVTSAAPKMTMGTSATAAFATNHDCVTPAERLCIGLFSICSLRHDMRPWSGTRPLMQLSSRSSATRVGRSCVGSRSGSGATLGRGDSRRWNSRTIVGAERIASPGVTPTAAAAIQAPVAVRDYEAELTCCERADVWSGRVLPVGARPGEGLLSQPTAVARPWTRERVFMPHSRPCQREEATARSGESGLPDLLGPEIPVL